MVPPLQQIPILREYWVTWELSSSNLSLAETQQQDLPLYLQLGLKGQRSDS